MRSRENPRAAHGPPPVANGRSAAPPAVLCIQQPGEAEIRRLVQALQANLRECESGAEALAVARERTLACILAPLELPDMPAREFIAQLHAAAPGLPVIVIVDNPAISEAVAVMRSGAHAVVDGRILSSSLLPQLAPLVRAG